MTFILAIQAVFGLLLTFCILLQHRAAGLSALGGPAAVQVQRRGAERVIFQGTILFSILFFGLIVVQWYL